MSKNARVYKPEEMYNYTPVYVPMPALTITQYNQLPTVCFEVSEELIPYLLGVLEIYRWEDRFQGDAADKRNSVGVVSDLMAALMVAVACGEADENMRLRQKPTDSCVLQASYDAGTTWQDVFNYDLCFSKIGSRPSGTEINNYLDNTYATYASNTTNAMGDVNNITNNWLYGDADDGFRDDALCPAIAILVDMICETAIQLIEDQESGQDSFYNSVGGFLAGIGGVIGGSLALGVTAVLGVTLAPWMVIGAALCGAVIAIGSVLNNSSFAEAKEIPEEARRDVVCEILASLIGQTPTFANFQTALDAHALTGESAELAEIVKPFLDDINIFYQLFVAADPVVQAIKDGAVIDCVCENWCYTFDFTIDEQGWTPYVIGGTFGATHSAAVGWKPIDNTSDGRNNRAAAIKIDIAPTTITRITALIDFTKGAWTTPPVEDAYVFEEFLPREFIYQVQQTATINGDDQEIIWEGTLEVSENIGVTIRSSRTTGTATGDCTIKSITLHGTGTNPFGADNC